MEIGQQLPAVPFKISPNAVKGFNDYLGQWLIIYFYPKDATPGCTTEACDFRDDEKMFSMHNATILGVSRDNLSSHAKFKANHALPFDLISDADETLCQLFDVIKMKSMYGKQVRGIERSTFLVDPTGVVRYVWRNVKVAGHVEMVLKVLQSLQA